MEHPMAQDTKELLSTRALAPTLAPTSTRSPALDGMRALFVLGVVAFHLWADAHDWKIDPGNVGVVGFFALSGYLITGLLIKEHDQNGRINMSYFYARRALRLLPALCLLLFVWFAVDLIFSNGQFLATVPSAHTPGSPVSWITGLEGVSAALLYVTNWLNVEPHWHLWYGYSPISHLWTLAVEEQFYVIWAPVMILLLRLRRHAATLVAAAIALAALIEPVFLSSSNFNRVYFGTDTRSAALFCGALCAFVGSTKGWRFLRTATWAPFLGVAIVGAIGWSCYALRQEGHRGLWNTGLIVCTLACALAVVYIVERPERLAARFLSTRLLVAIGKRSYALYLWSYVLNTWLRDSGGIEPYLVIAASFLAAEISYRFVELPALRLKHHFETTKTTDPPPLPAPDNPPSDSLGEKVLISH
jgi:peptidoglycan/LPS O-acetylase OafA/YrhL